MSVIQAKKMPVLQKGEGYTYNPETFIKEHKVAQFHECTAEEVLLKCEPFVFQGRRFISFDTEAHPFYKSSQDVPASVVRRWIGKGKTAAPIDFPFSIQICDANAAYTVYDSVENGFKEFKKLLPIFMNASIEKIAHNVKFDMHMFANAGLKIVGKLHDTVVAAKIADENRKSFQLRDLAAHIEKGITKFEFMVDSFKQLNKITDYRQIARPLLNEYGCADVWNCKYVFIDEYEKILEEGLVDLYNQEMESTLVLYEMERRGMMVDESYEGPLKNELQHLADTAEQSIYDEAGCMFNINSGPQLHKVLMNLGVDPTWIPTTPKGNPKLDKDVLNNLADVRNVSIVKKIQEYRQYEKLLTTYAVGIYDQRDAEGRVHGNINQTEATTGRMSITKPALQTLPKKDKRIRKAFIPSPGFTLWFLDLDQVEYRLFAHYAKIPSLIEAIKNGYDVHAATAAKINHIDIDVFLKGMHEHETLKLEIKELEARALAEATMQYEERIKFLKETTFSLQKYVDMRGNGKTINFALIYGVGTEHLAELLHCSVTEATMIRAQYFSELPEAKTFINTVHNVIKLRGCVRNFYGRKRRLTSNESYKAPNALIQGCAADYIKSKINLMYKYIKYNGLKTRLINIVHDETIPEVANGEESHVPMLRWLMSDFDTFRCPITAGCEKGDPSWGQKIEPDDVGFKEPTDKGYEDYNIWDGSVFDIYKEAENVA